MPTGGLANIMPLELQLSSWGFWILRKVVSSDLAREIVLWNQLCSLPGKYVGKDSHLGITAYINQNIQWNHLCAPPCSFSRLIPERPTLIVDGGA